MPRFDYLENQESSKKSKKAAKTVEAAEAVYIRRETVRTAWRELKSGGSSESLSELVDDLLLTWLQQQAARRERSAEEP